MEMVEITTLLLLLVAVMGETGAEPERVEEEEFLVDVNQIVSVKETVVVESIVEVEFA